MNANRKSCYEEILQMGYPDKLKSYEPGNLHQEPLGHYMPKIKPCENEAHYTLSKYQTPHDQPDKGDGHE
jgi:hypothetical protein